MNLKLFGDSVKISQHMSSYAEKKLSKFERYFGDDANFELKYRPEGNALRSEITLHVDKDIYRSFGLAQSSEEALDLAINSLERQIRKHKSKISKRLRRRSQEKAYQKFQEATASFASDYDSLDVQDEFKVREKSFLISQMTDEEAILQMELLNHDFFLYLSAEDAKVVLVYRRHDGTYGRIRPEY